jgi:hypothetical protein
MSIRPAQFLYISCYYLNTPHSRVGGALLMMHMVHACAHGTPWFEFEFELQMSARSRAAARAKASRNDTFLITRKAKGNMYRSLKKAAAPTIPVNAKIQ